MDSHGSYLEDKNICIERGKVKLKNNITFSLQELCLLRVKKNLKDFCVAYSATSNTTLLKNFHFLQRRYSTQLMEMLDGKMMSDFHLNLLVNEHLKEIHIQRLYDLDPKTVIKKFEKVGHGFLKVDFNDPCLEEEAEEESSRIIEFVNSIVQQLPNVKILQLDFSCSDETLRIISSVCHKLEELYISNCDVTADGLKLYFTATENTATAFRLNSLRKLNLLCNNYSENDIKLLLRNIPSLQFLRHPELQKALHSLCVEDNLNSRSSSPKKYKLTNIVIYWQDKLPATLSSIAEVCPFIRTLEVTSLNQTDLELLCHFTHLEDLTIEMNLDLNILLELIGHRLKKLTIIFCKLSLSVLIQNCPHLEYLYLVRVNVDIFNANYDNIKCLSKLVELHLVRMNLSPQWLGMIFKSAPNLERLNFVCISGFEKLNEFKTMFPKYCENSRLVFLSFKDWGSVEKGFLKSIIMTNSLIETLCIHSCPNIRKDEIKALDSYLQKSGKSMEIFWRKKYVCDFCY